MLVALLGVLAVAAVAGYALAKPSAPSAPSITAKPNNPTNATTASFTYSDTDTIQKFQCSLDNAAFADCGTTNPATKTPAYSGLAAGSHTFQVRAVNANGTSSATLYTWVVDLTAPTVASINRAAASPTNAASVSWTVTFSETVSGVDVPDFALAHGASPTGGTITVSPAGPATVYTVSAPSGSGDGSLGLNLNDNDSIVDGVGNKLGGTGTGTVTGGGTGNGSFTGQVYVIDKTGPANAPTITGGPSQNSLVASTNVSFAFSATESGVAGFECKLDASAFDGCSSPKSYSNLAQGSHDFSVRAVDALGNPGPASALRHWTVDTVKPVKPVFDQTPPAVATTATSTFRWHDAEDPNVTYLCSRENGAFAATVASEGQAAQPCVSPLTYNVGVTNNGQHQFAVEAVDAAGNISEIASYSWKVDKGSPQNYAITGSAVGLLYPTHATVGRPINLAFYNPNSGNGGTGVNGVQVAGITVAIASVIAPNATALHPCGSVDFAVTQFSGSYPFYIPQGASTLQSLGFAQSTWPTVRLVDRPVNQDGCKGATVNLTYSGHS
jgi:hypothetical protein